MKADYSGKFDTWMDTRYLEWQANESDTKIMSTAFELTTQKWRFIWYK